MANVNVILDEAASLGPNMGCIEDAIQLGRGYGIRLQMYYQTPAQLKECYPNGQDQTVLANMTQVFFAVNDLDNSAHYISNRLGDETIITETGGTSSGHSTQTPHGGGHGSSSESTNRSRNWNQMARRLLKPEEILSMSERFAIAFVPGMRPILTKLERYYETKGCKPDHSASTALIISLYFMLVLFACVLELSKFL